MKTRIELTKEQIDFIKNMLEEQNSQAAMKEFGALMVKEGLHPKDMGKTIDRISKVWESRKKS